MIPWHSTGAAEVCHKGGSTMLWNRLEKERKLNKAKGNPPFNHLALCVLSSHTVILPTPSAARPFQQVGCRRRWGRRQAFHGAWTATHSIPVRSRAASLATILITTFLVARLGCLFLAAASFLLLCLPSGLSVSSYHCVPWWSGSSGLGCPTVKTRVENAIHEKLVMVFPYWKNMNSEPGILH